MPLVNNKPEIGINKLTVLTLSQFRTEDSINMLDWHADNYLEKFNFDSLVIMPFPKDDKIHFSDKIIFAKSKLTTRLLSLANLNKWSCLGPLLETFYPYYFHLPLPDGEFINQVGHKLVETEVTDPVEWLFLTQSDTKVGFCAPLITKGGARAVAIMTRSNIGGRFDDAAAYLGILEFFARVQGNLPAQKSSSQDLLNAREIECLKWVAAGKTSCEIAKITSLSEHTVNHYLQVCCKKLDTVNRIQAVVTAIRRQLI